MNEQRLVEIETKLAHQELLIGELNQVISDQQSTIDQLQISLKKLLQGYLGSRENPRNEKPPHY